MSTVGIDFDGVIHAYTKGWQQGAIYDDPVPGTAEALRKIMADHAVFVFTSRTNLRDVADWIAERLDIPVLCAHPDAPREFWNNQDCIYVTNVKLPASVYIDDRAIRFINWDQALTDLASVGG